MPRSTRKGNRPPLSPRELLALPPDLLSDSCDRLAHSLLVGDGPESDDPFSCLAQQILAQMLMDWVHHTKAKERGSDGKGNR